MTREEKGPPPYDKIMLRITRDWLALFRPEDATISRHLRGMRSKLYREQLPSYQLA